MKPKAIPIPDPSYVTFFFTPFSMPIGPFLSGVLRFHDVHWYGSIFMYCSEYWIDSFKLETYVF